MSTSLMVVPQLQSLSQREQLWRAMESVKQELREVNQTIDPLIALGARRRLPADLVAFLEEVVKDNQYFIEGLEIRTGFIEAAIAEEMGLANEPIEEHVYHVRSH